MGDLGSIPESGRSPGERNGNPLQYSCLENPMDGRAWWATQPTGSQRVGLHFHFQDKNLIGMGSVQGRHGFSARKAFQSFPHLPEFHPVSCSLAKWVTRVAPRWPSQPQEETPWPSDLRAAFPITEVKRGSKAGNGALSLECA